MALFKKKQGLPLALGNIESNFLIQTEEKNNGVLAWFFSSGKKTRFNRFRLEQKRRGKLCPKICISLYATHGLLL